jgi:predicted amidohydrolase YtcJ
LNGLVWFFDHAETVSEANLQRIKALGGGIAIQHRMAYQGRKFYTPLWEKSSLGCATCKKACWSWVYQWEWGTDGTRVASYNPWIALYWITTGKTIGGTQVMAKENTLDRATALKLYTSGGYSLIKERLKGKIQKGYAADLVMLNKDYFSVPE